MAQGRAFNDRGIVDRRGGSTEAMATTGTRRLAAILAADVAGYSRLMGADEEGTFDRLKAIHRQLVDPKISEHHGRIVKTTGDGMLAEFSSVVDAVRCAVEIQRGDGRPQLPRTPRTSASPSASASISATSLSMATIFSATASTSRRGWRPWPSRAASASRARSATTSATGCPTLSRTLGNKASRTSPSRYMPTR